MRGQRILMAVVSTRWPSLKKRFLMGAGALSQAASAEIFLLLIHRTHIVQVHNRHRLIQGHFNSIATSAAC